jgi:hypothetical protein
MAGDRGKPSSKGNGTNKEFMGRGKSTNNGMGAPKVSGAMKKGDTRSKTRMAPIKPQKGC